MSGFPAPRRRAYAHDRADDRARSSVHAPSRTVSAGRCFARLRRSESGLGAVEFALIAPVMILIMFSLVELPRAVMTGQRVARAARTMADLISRGSLTSVDDIYAAGHAVMVPYDDANAAFVLTAVGVYAEGTAFSSRTCSSVANAKGTKRPVNVKIGAAPPASAAASERYVMAEIESGYKPFFDVVPGLSSLVFKEQVAWPVRRGTVYNGKAEVVLPGGAACPAT